MHNCLTCKGNSIKGACNHCRKRLKKILKELIALMDLLNSNASLRQQNMTKQEGRGSLTHTLVVNVQLLDLLSKTGIYSVLNSWIDLITDQRDLAPFTASNSDTRLHQMQKFLETHVDWLADQDLWPDFYNEIKEPWTQLRMIVLGERKPPKPVRCPVQDCQGILILEFNGNVHCSNDQSHSWLYEEWTRLAMLISVQTEVSSV